MLAIHTYMKSVTTRPAVVLLAGEGILENVQLRVDAFDYLQLPFVVKEGCIGGLKLQVRSKQLSQPQQWLEQQCPVQIAISTKNAVCDSADSSCNPCRSR